MGFLRFLEALEGLESSGRLVGFISTNPGTYKYSWCRVMTKNRDRVEKVNFIMVLFLNFDVLMEDSKVFDLRFGFLVKNYLYFTPCMQEIAPTNRKV